MSNNSKWSSYDDKIIELLEEGELTPSKIAKKLTKDKKEHTEAVRKRVYKVKERIERAGGHSGLQSECDSVGIPIDSVGTYWYKSKMYSIKANKTYPTVQEITSSFDRIAEKYLDGGFKPKLREPKPFGKFMIKGTMSDSHVGMAIDGDDKLFSYEYDADKFCDSVDKFYESLTREYLIHGKAEKLVIQDLGDRADGWAGKTTRGGHDLPQNMDEVDVFDVCVDAMVELVIKCVEANIAHKVEFVSVGNDNHAGNFGMIINKAVKKIVNRIYDESIVECINYSRFLDHYEYGDHTFILTHGKDKKHMKFGLPLVLNDKTVNFINSYINHYKIDSKYIHVEKGDLHQLGYQRSKRFDYRNHASFAPPSGWVQHNFGDTYSGFSVQVVPKHSQQIIHTDYLLDYSL